MTTALKQLIESIDNSLMEEAVTAGGLEALRWYQHHGSAGINKGLRKGGNSKSAMLAIEAIDELFEPAKKAMTLYRGSKWIEGHPAFGVRTGAPTKGEVFIEWAFSSTSISEATARQYTNATCLKIALPAGAPVIMLSEMMGNHSGGRSEEGEVLLPRGQRFEITGHTLDGKLLREVEVTVLR